MGCKSLRVSPSQSSKGAGVEQRVLQALMAKRFAKVVAQLERADSSVEVQPLSHSFQSFLGLLLLPLEMTLQAADSPSSVCHLG